MVAREAGYTRKYIVTKKVAFLIFCVYLQMSVYIFGAMHAGITKGKTHGRRNQRHQFMTYNDRGLGSSKPSFSKILAHFQIGATSYSFFRCGKSDTPMSDSSFSRSYPPQLMARRLVVKQEDWSEDCVSKYCFLLLITRGILFSLAIYKRCSLSERAFCAHFFEYSIQFEKLFSVAYKNLISQSALVKKQHCRNIDPVCSG